MTHDSLTDFDRLEARGRRLRRVVLLLILGAAAAAGLFVWRFWFSGDDEQSQELQTVAVGRATIRATIAASGTAEAVDETALSFASAGRVKEILVTLGQEVKANTPLALLETDDPKNRLATAEVNLAMARIRLRQLLKGADEAELAAAEQSVASAQATLSKGERDLIDLLEGPSEADLAAAEQTLASAESALASARANLASLVQSPSPAELSTAQDAVLSAEAAYTKAQADLDRLLEQPTAAELAAAEQAVASAQSTLDSARAKLQQLENSPSEADLAMARAAVTTAEANLTTAQNLVDSARSSLDSEEADLLAAGDAYCDAIDEVGRTDALCPYFSMVPLDQASVDRLLDELSDPDKDADLDCDDDIPPWLCPTLHDMVQALLNANSSYVSAENTLANAEANLESAEAGLLSARASLDALAELPVPEDLQAAQAAVTAAEEGLEAAQANLTETLSGADSITVQAAQDALASAAANLGSARARVDELAPSSEDLEAARSAVNSAEESVEAAEKRLQELREGPDARDIQAAEDAVRSAEASLNTAIAARDELQRGADPDDVDLQRQQVRLAEIGIDEAQKAVDDATLKAPYDGTVGGIDIQVGDLVSSQLPAVTLLTPGALMVRLAIGETDLPSLRQGMVGLMIFDAIQGRPFPVVITAIGLQPKVEQGIVTYTVEGALIGAGEEVASRPAPGMNGRAMLVTEERRDVLAVPNTSIRRRGDDIVVEVVVDGESELRPIETGLSDTDNTEVLAGLEEGDLAVVPGTAQAEEEREEEALPEGIR